MNKHILVEKSRGCQFQRACSWSLIIFANCICLTLESLPKAPTGKRQNAPSESSPARSSTYQLAHAALLAHPVLTLVVEAHLAGFAAEAVLRRVSRQEHHVLGRRA